MTTTPRYSLWLQPEGAVADALRAVIDRLAQEYGGPAFAPHLTLFGSFDATEARALDGAARLAASLAPITIYLDDIGAGDTYFQSLFALARPTPEVLAARDAAYATFPDTPRVPFMPHVSLLYGHPAPATKRAIIDTLGGTLPPSFTARFLTLNATGPDVAAWRQPLRADLNG